MNEDKNGRNDFILNGFFGNTQRLCYMIRMFQNYRYLFNVNCIERGPGRFGYSAPMVRFYYRLEKNSSFPTPEFFLCRYVFDPV